MRTAARPPATATTTSKPFVRKRSTGPFWYAKWSRAGKPIVRGLGRAWVVPDGNGGWKPRCGTPADGHLTEAQAASKMLEDVASHDTEQTRIEADADARRRDGITFRELAAEYMAWLADIKDAKPATLATHSYRLAEPGTPHKRGGGKTPGFLMETLGDTRITQISAKDIERVLRRIAQPRVKTVRNEDGRRTEVTVPVTARTVNSYRQLLSAIFSYAMRPSTYDLPANPVKYADRRREPEPAPLVFYTVEQVEALARAFADGAHRNLDAQEVGADELAARSAQDRQDAELIRVAADTGLRRGELVALKWSDVNFQAHKVTVRRAVSGYVETNSTKSRRSREVPLPDQAAAALDRLSRRGEFTAPSEYVFVNRLGRRIDPTALRRRYERARDAAGLDPLRFHDLRHTYGSLLVAGGVDLASVKTAMGHSRITTIERYLHARPATEQAARFTAALRGALGTASVTPSPRDPSRDGAPA